MKRIKRIGKIKYLLVLLLAICLIGCNENTNIEIKLEDNIINGIDLEVGETKELNYTTTNNGLVDCKSDNEEIVSIEDNKVTALKIGECTITITSVDDPSVSVSIDVTVYKKLELFDVSEKEISIEKGTESKIELVYDNTCRTNFVFKTDNDNVQVSNDGTISGKKKGSSVVTITEEISGLSQEVTVSITSKLTSFEVDVKQDIVTGEEAIINLVFDEAEETSFTFKATGGAVTVENGVVKGVKQGTSVVTVTEEISGISVNVTIEVTVNSEEPDKINELIDWAIETAGKEGFLEVVLPTTHPDYDCTFTWESSDKDALMVEDGYLEYYEHNVEVDLTCICNFNGEEQSKTYTFTILGAAIMKLQERVYDQITGGRIYKTIDFVTEYPDYGGSTIKIESSDQEIFTNNGVFIKPLEPTEITLSFTYSLTEPKETYTISKVFKVEGMNIGDIVLLASDWIDLNVGADGSVSKSTIFPDYIEEYKAELVWMDAYGEPLNFDRTVGNPIFSDGLDAQIKIIFKGKYDVITRHYRMTSEDIADMWDAAKLFVETIGNTAVQTYSYVLVSWTDTNLGYLPFYENENVNPLVDIILYTYGHQRTGILKTSTEYIVVHDTGNPSASANAEMHRRYLTNLNNALDSTSISWHYTVDEKQAIQHLPLDEVAYHAGDGSRVFGDTYYNTTYGADSIGGGNRNGIGIESCINQGSNYTDTMRRLAKLVAELLIQYNLGFDRIKQHNAFSGKNCPQVMRENNRWNEFIYLVQLEYFAKTTLKGVTFEWVSDVPFMDNRGKITTAQSVGAEIKYHVNVTYEGETRTFSFTNTLKKR